MPLQHTRQGGEMYSATGSDQSCLPFTIMWWKVDMHIATYSTSLAKVIMRTEAKSACYVS